MSAAPAPPTVAVVMGVAGSGKSTVGRALAGALGWSFAEGDSFHPEANVAKMASEIPLTDGDRWPWLDAIATWIGAEVGAGRSAVVACSALKRAYRDRLRRAWPALRVVYLEGSRELLASRIAERSHHFFPGSLLGSQLADLEPPSPDEGAIVVPLGGSPEELVATIETCLTAGSRRP